MARIGSALVALLIAAPALAEVRFDMAADRSRVGTEEAFHLEIVVGNAPEGAVVQFPAANGFEILSRSESTQMSYSMGPGGAGVIEQLRKYTLTVRATRAGSLVIPPATLKTSGRTYKTDPVRLLVTRGRLGPDRSAPRPGLSPFGFPPMPGFGGDDDQGDPFADLGPDRVPRSDSDLFLRSRLSDTEVWVGQQVTLAILIYSRIDLSSVDAVTMPKLEGFWSQDIKTPSQLSPSQRVIGGVPYREYTLREKALFPMKPGTYEIEPAEADITTGFLFAGHRVHRKGNALKLKVRALPKGGTTSNVGQYRLTAETTQTDVQLGDPVQLKLRLEGRGNLQAVQLPALEAPPSFRVFDPQTTDKLGFTRDQLSGSRTVEYVLVPQQTGTFTLPALSVPFFDPDAGRYDEAHTDPITITVRPGPQGQQVVAAPRDGEPPAPEGPKNQLTAGGLKSLRHTARFDAPRPPLWSRGFFLPVAVLPLGLSLAWWLVGLVRGALGREDPAAARKRQARAARRRLAGAERLLKAGSTGDFYAEVARAMTSFLEARLEAPVTGLTRAALDAQMAERAVPEAVRRRVLAVLETCDTGRFAPGMGEADARRRAMDDAAAAMEAWA